MIKKLIPAILLCLFISGCSIYEETEIDQKVQPNPEVSSYHEKYREIFFSDRKPTEATQELLNKEFTTIEGIEFIQHSNGREVKVYESRYVKGYYVLDDGYWTYPIEPCFDEPKEGIELFRRLNKTDFTPYAFYRASSGAGIITCANREYAVMDISGRTPFSINYDDVDVIVENMPLTTVIYEKEGKADIVEIYTAVTDYKDSFSPKNTEELKGLFDELGLGEESADLAQEVTQSLNKKSYSRTSGARKITSARNIARNGDITYNLFRITL